MGIVALCKRKMRIGVTWVIIPIIAIILPISMLLSFIFTPLQEAPREEEWQAVVDRIHAGELTMETRNYYSDRMSAITRELFTLEDEEDRVAKREESARLREELRERGYGDLFAAAWWGGVEGHEWVWFSYDRRDILEPDRWRGYLYFDREFYRGNDKYVIRNLIIDGREVVYVRQLRGNWYHIRLRR